MANWLDKYEQGGIVLKQKAKDNYGKQSNYNDAKVSTPPGYVGMGYDTKGRNYSPAWGGQFEDGGKVYKSKPMAQSSDIKSASNTFNADDFSQYSTIINKYPNMSNDTSYMYARNTPTGTEQFFHNTNQGKPVSQLQRGNEFINLSPQDVEAYKKKVLGGTGGFAMGGALPGAVGFMYARTQNPAPSNGKYTKKTKASAENGTEMKYWQEGLDFKPKTISENGSWLDKYQPEPMRQDATRNVIPRKMTDKERLEAAAVSDQAQKRTLANAQQVIAERENARKQKGSVTDSSDNGKFTTSEKYRAFPKSVGGLGEMFDEYVNPAYFVAKQAENLGNNIRTGNKTGIASNIVESLGAGALGLDPLGSGIKLANSDALNSAIRDVGSRFKGIGMPVREFESVPHPQEAFNTAVQQLRNERVSQSAGRVPYQPPTDAELAGMNEVEANRYYRRPTEQVSPNPDSFDWTAPRPDPANRPPVDRDVEMARFRERLAQSNARDREREGARRLSEDIFGPDFSAIGSQEARVNTVLDVPISGQEHEAEMQRIAESGAYDSGPEYGQSGEDLASYHNPYVRPQHVIEGPKWGDKDFKFNSTSNIGRTETRDPATGHTFMQDVTDHGNFTSGSYNIGNGKGGYMHINTEMPKVGENPYLNVKDISFFNGDEKSAVDQFKTIMGHLPPQVKMDRISTSMYSQPLMNQQVARWANNQPGRIILEDIKMKPLNTFTKSSDYLNELIKQFPKIQKTYKSISENTGYNLPEPSLIKINRETYAHEPITLDELKSDAFQQSFRANPELGRDIRINAPTYKLTKNWKDGGHTSNGWLNKYK